MQGIEWKTKEMDGQTGTRNWRKEKEIDFVHEVKREKLSREREKERERVGESTCKTQSQVDIAGTG